MKTKFDGHTPGPWMREWANDGEYTGPADNPPGSMGEDYETLYIEACEDMYPVGVFNRPEDADLGAAAPDLLAELIASKKLLEALAPDYGYGDVASFIAQQIAAINKLLEVKP